MCGCNNENNVVDLQHIKIYTTMAEYKTKMKGGASYFNGRRVRW